MIITIMLFASNNPEPKFPPPPPGCHFTSQQSDNTHHVYGPLPPIPPANPPLVYGPQLPAIPPANYVPNNQAQPPLNNPTIVNSNYNNGDIIIIKDTNGETYTLKYLPGGTNSQGLQFNPKFVGWYDKYGHILHSRDNASMELYARLGQSVKVKYPGKHEIEIEFALPYTIEYFRRFDPTSTTSTTTTTCSSTTATTPIPNTSTTSTTSMTTPIPNTSTTSTTSTTTLSTQQPFDTKKCDPTVE